MEHGKITVDRRVLKDAAHIIQALADDVEAEARSSSASARPVRDPAAVERARLFARLLLGMLDASR